MPLPGLVQGMSLFKHPSGILLGTVTRQVDTYTDAQHQRRPPYPHLPVPQRTAHQQGQESQDELQELERIGRKGKDCQREQTAADTVLPVLMTPTEKDEDHYQDTIQGRNTPGNTHLQIVCLLKR